MAPYSCKKLSLSDIIATMAEDNRKVSMEVNGVTENGFTDAPCK